MNRTETEGPAVSNRGRRGPTWWARRRAEKLRLKKQRKLDKADLKLKELEIRKAEDAYVEEKSGRAEAAKEAKTAAARAAVKARWRAFRERLANDRPLLAAVVMSGVCLVVEFVGQLMFYGDLNWPRILLFMPVLLSTIVTGATWTFAINADYLTSKGLSGAADIRKMWYWSGAAAVTNGYHGVVVLGELSVGIVLGSASLVGPYIWHRYVTLQKVAKSGRTAEQIRAALLRRLFHPFLWRRATDLWAAADGAMSTSAAWRLTWVQAKGGAPGALPPRALTPARNRWLFRLVFGRVVTPLPAPARSAPLGRSSRHGEALTKRAEQRSLTGSAAETSAPGTLADDAIIKSAEALMLDVERWLEEAASAQSALVDDAPEALTNTQTSSSNDVSGTLEERSVSAPSPSVEHVNESAPEGAPEGGSESALRAPRPVKPGPSVSARRARRTARRARGVDFTQAVTEYFEERLRAGAQPDDVSGPDAARATGASEQHARKVLAKLRKEREL
jgi:hypothetical protein